MTTKAHLIDIPAVQEGDCAEQESDYDMSIHLNPDAAAWAKFFMECKEKNEWTLEQIDEALILGWFANAMMAMHDHVRSQRKMVDGAGRDGFKMPVLHGDIFREVVIGGGV